MSVAQATTAPPQAPPRIASLDGLRAIGFVLVFAFHAKLPGLFAGRLGVDVFFPLSGYLITDLLLRERATTGRVHFTRFYTRRAARLYPVLIVTIAGTGVLYEAVGYASPKAFLTSALLAATYTTNLAIGWGHHVAADDALSPTWSLALEEQFYLLWPWSLLALNRFLKQRGAIVVVLVAAVAGWWSLATGPDKVVYFRPEARMSGLLLGCATALWLRGHTPSLRASRTCLRAAIALGVVALVAGSLRNHEWFSDTVGIPAASASAALLIPTLLRWPDGVGSRWLSHPWMLWVGRRSYALYLVHSPLIFLLWRAGFGHGETAVLAGALALGISAVLFRLVEQPVLAWRDRLSFRTQ